jgi:hypothetical protein
MYFSAKTRRVTSVAYGLSGFADSRSDSVAFHACDFVGYCSTVPTITLACFLLLPVSGLDSGTPKHQVRFSCVFSPHFRIGTLFA